MILDSHIISRYDSAVPVSILIIYSDLLSKWDHVTIRIFCIILHCKKVFYFIFLSGGVNPWVTLLG